MLYYLKYFAVFGDFKGEFFIAEAVGHFALAAEELRHGFSEFKGIKAVGNYPTALAVFYLRKAAFRLDVSGSKALGGDGGEPVFLYKLADSFQRFFAYVITAKEAEP